PYIVLRNIDLNPFERYGISEEQVEFLQLFLLYLLWKDEGDHTQLEGDANKMLDEMEQFVEALDLPVSDRLFVHLREMLLNPSKTLADSQAATLIAKENY